jgi:hypothetical protein
MAKRIQRKRHKGWRMPPNTVSVTRPGKWGNPFRVAMRPRAKMSALCNILDYIAHRKCIYRAALKSFVYALQK